MRGNTNKQAMNKLKDNELNDVTKNTMSKSEIITIRVSKKVREQLKLFDKENHENESQFIRHLIENGLDHVQDKPKQVSSYMGNPSKHNTRTPEYYWSGHEKPTSKLIFAMSLLLTIDTGKKTTEIIKLLQNYDYESEMTTEGTQTRIKWEKYYLELRRLIISHLSPSQTALVVIDTMILSFLSVIFPSPVFMASELSMLMIDSFDMLLIQKSKNNEKHTQY